MSFEHHRQGWRTIQMTLVGEMMCLARSWATLHGCHTSDVINGNWKYLKITKILDLNRLENGENVQ